jgi:hypothetical protein
VLWLADAWPRLRADKAGQLSGAWIASNAIVIGRIRHRQCCNHNLPWCSKQLHANRVLREDTTTGLKAALITLAARPSASGSSFVNSITSSLIRYTVGAVYAKTGRRS